MGEVRVGGDVDAVVVGEADLGVGEDDQGVSRPSRVSVAMPDSRSGSWATTRAGRPSSSPVRVRSSGRMPTVTSRPFGTGTGSAIRTVSERRAWASVSATPRRRLIAGSPTKSATKTLAGLS